MPCVGFGAVGSRLLLVGNAVSANKGSNHSFRDVQSCKLGTTSVMADIRVSILKNDVHGNKCNNTRDSEDRQQNSDSYPLFRHSG